MTATSGKNNLRAEKGIALLIAIFTLLLLTAVGFGMILLTNTDTNISANFRDEQTAFFAAKAGLEEARDRMRGSASNTISGSLPTALLGSANGAVYITNPLSASDYDTPWNLVGGANTGYPDTEVCTEVTNMNRSGITCGANPAVPYTTTTASTAYQPASGALAWKWTRINLKTNLTASGTSSGSSLSTVDGSTSDTSELVCWTGAYEITTTNATCQSVNANYQPVYAITTLAVTPSGSRRMVQAEAAATTFPSLPGPLIFDGSNPTFGAPNSNVFSVNGNDQSGVAGNTYQPTNGTACPSGQPSQYALGAFGGAAVTTLQTDANKRPNNYTGTGNTGGTTGTASSGDVTTALGTLATVGGLQALESEVTLVAGNFGNVYTTNNPTITNPGTDANPQVNVVQGNLTLTGGWTGAGILLVEGNLELKGNVAFNGLLLVIGTGNVTKDGGGNATLDGSMLVANLYDGSGNPLASSSAPGAPQFNWNGGGNATFQYDSCWSTAMSNSLAYRIVAVRELMK